ncbi:MAG TPA: hypothetical protein PK367_02525 [Candidatus Paceibacterota bacterium]|nr:hypothetical protein [Candidatus Paceibacterota bacterium]
MIASPKKESWIIGLGSEVDNQEIIALCTKMVEELGDSCPNIVKIPRKGSSDIRIEFECLNGFGSGHYIITESTLEYLRARVELMILEHKVRTARIDLSKLRPTRWSVDCLGGDSW